MATTAIRFELKNFLVSTAAESSAESSQSTTRIQSERETEREMSSGARSRHRQALGRMKISYKVSYNFLFHSQQKKYYYRPKFINFVEFLFFLFE